MICKWYNGNKFSDKVDHICVGDFHLIFFIFIGQGFFNKEQTKLCFVMVLLRIFYLIRHWVRIMKSVLAFICLYRKIPVIISGFILIQTHFFLKGVGVYIRESFKQEGLIIGGTFLSEKLYCSVFIFYLSVTKYKMKQPSIVFTFTPCLVSRPWIRGCFILLVLSYL